MKRSLSSILFSLTSGSLLAAACGCGAGSETSPDTQAATPVASSSDERSDACPTALPGATFAIEDTVDGVVVLFSTPKQGDRAELVRRAERLADVHNQRQSEAAQEQTAAPPQGPGPVVNEAGADSQKLEATASVEPGQADEGVRLVLRPKDPAQLDANRDPLRKQADDLVQRVCDETGRKNLH